MKEIMQASFRAIFVLWIVSGCSPATQTSLPAETLQPTTPVRGICPAETAALKLFVNTRDGYCLLYPKEDTAIPPYLIVIDPTGTPGDKPGDAWVQITAEAASGRTAAQVADGQITQAGGGFNITRSEILIGRKPAVIVDGLPGPDPWRKVFVVDNDHLYTLFFLPWSPNTQGFAQLEELYSAVVGSLVFLPPTP